MEVMRGSDGAGDVERTDALRFDVNHAALVLKCAFDAQKAAAGDDDAVALENVRSEDDVGDPGLSSRERKTNLLAVAGRWRAMTHPAMRMD